MKRYLRESGQFAIPFESHGNLHIIHPSLRVPGGIQVTSFVEYDETKPSGHQEYKNEAELLSDLLPSGDFKIDHPVFELMPEYLFKSKGMKFMIEAKNKAKETGFEDKIKEAKYRYLQPYRPLSSDGRAYKLPGFVFGANVDNNTKGFLYFTEPITLSKQEDIALVPFGSNAFEAAISDYIKEHPIETW